MKLEMGPNERTGRALVGKLEGDAAVIHIVQKIDNKEVGGLSILVMNNKEKSAGGKNQ